MFEVIGIGLAAAGQWGLAKLPCSEHAVTVMSPQLKTKTKTKGFDVHEQCVPNFFSMTKLSLIMPILEL